MMERNQYYPDLSGITICVNTQKSFQYVWSIMKSFFSERERKKYVLLGINYREKWFKVLQQDMTPIEYGGTCEIPFESWEE